MTAALIAAAPYVAALIALPLFTANAVVGFVAWLVEA